MHFVAFNGIRDARIEDAPTHMFEVSGRMPVNINSAGWHVAHIFNVKDRNTDWQNWTRKEFVRRFIRNVHPCNCFYVPKTNWQKFGGDPRVIGFMAARYRERYGMVWNEFVELAEGQELPHEDGDFRCLYSNEEAPRSSNTVVARSGTTAAYRSSRLCFKADVIEPLRDDEMFEVATPEGQFRMTKAEFYRVFPGVVASRSYREGRIYHYPKTSKVALQYRV